MNELSEQSQIPTSKYWRHAQWIITQFAWNTESYLFYQDLRNIFIETHIYWTSLAIWNQIQIYQYMNDPIWHKEKDPT